MKYFAQNKMPRTKAVKKKASPELCGYSHALIPIILEQKKQIHIGLEQKSTEFLHKLRAQLAKLKLSIPKNIADKTIGELVELPVNWSGNSTIQILDATKILNEKKRQNSSCGNDDGYLTADSSRSVSGDRISRPRRKLQKTARPSRSLSSRQKAIADKYKTPGQKIPPSIYGTVTPKIKPNMPQVILRRPIQGEVVLSMQGSPLLAGSVSVDNIANVNVPLEGGRLFSIQPQKGLRLSQIPELDPEIKRQLETLRDNLNKVCALPGKRK
ncbi:hypothetical protein MTP99_000648 [Tenebrio molitor]|nr:hypothetical protein MTP99_000648 [Tenebrio molitor]